MSNSKRIITVTQFKANCFNLMNIVHNKHVNYIITKRGKAMAKLIPILDEPVNYFGFLKETASTAGDIIGPLDIKWDAEK